MNENNQTSPDAPSSEQLQPQIFYQPQAEHSVIPSLFVAGDHIPHQHRIHGIRRSKKARKKTRRVITLSVLSIFLAALICFCTWFLVFYHPDAETAAPKRSNVVQQIISNQVEDGYEDDAPEINDLTRKEGVYNFLVAGIDKLAGLSDVMMLVQFDTKQDKINVVQIPRDTYYSGSSNSPKLNSYFAICRNQAMGNGDADPYQSAIEDLCEFYEVNLYIKIDYYVCVDTNGFRDVIDAIGGVDFNVPMDMDYEDPYQDLYIHLKAGYQHLDGDKAEQFVRYRKGYAAGDIGRLDAQKLFLTAVANQLQNNLTLSTLVNTAKTVLKYMTTNVSAADVAYFAKEAYDIKKSDIGFLTMPGTPTSEPGVSVVVMHRASMLSVINKYLNVYKAPITDELFDHYKIFDGGSYYHSTEDANESTVTTAATLEQTE